ncbi:MAG: ECF transporter S component [Methanoculleus sp.]|nr:ECF transporter S component [Methanoculleus sp.]
MSSAEKYFTLNEIALMSLMGGLVFVMKTAFRMPLGIPGHTGIFLVIPVIIGVAIIRKPGSGTYIGLVSGVLLSFFGLSGMHVFDVFQYTALGASIDAAGYVFRYRMESVPFGVLAGIAGNLAKMVVNFAVDLAIGVPFVVVAVGAGISSVSHVLFGALGGFVSAYLVARLIKTGVISRDATGVDCKNS